MDQNILKTALFGYSKISVCQYIATMNEQFNAKLLAETESFREERAMLQQKINDLEAEIAVRVQSTCDIGAILLGAGEYAEQIRQQAQEEAAALLHQAHEEAAALLRQAQEEAAECRQTAQAEAEALRQETEKETAEALQLAQQESEETLRLAQEEATSIRSQANDEAEQLLLKIKEKGQVQTQRLDLYTGTITKLREDMAILASRTDTALHAFMEQFLNLRQDFEDQEE